MDLAQFKMATKANFKIHRNDYFSVSFTDSELKFGMIVDECQQITQNLWLKLWYSRWKVIHIPARKGTF